MSWLRSSPLRQSFSRNNGGGSSSFSFGTSPINAGAQSSSTMVIRQRAIDNATDCDPRACYDSFCKHWQQAHDIIQRSEPKNRLPTHDDVLGVVSHLDFMVTLLLVELHHCNKIQLPVGNGTLESQPPPAPCLEFMLSENLLDKLYEWGITTGRYANAVRLEQLKLYELLVSHSRHQLLCHEPFLRPLLKILASSQGEIFPPDLEKRLVILLNQLCVVLMQNVHLLDLFFFSAAQEQHKQNGNQTHNGTQTSTNFIIFSLLIPYVHREGSLGHQARDALLLCMALSQKNSNIGTYIAKYSSMCPLLVTGLGGLYSRLPNSIEITSIDWHRITPDDVAEMHELTLFMNALEFCNAVVQVAHDLIKTQLLDFMYQGFIVPVLGPAILQTNVDSQISAMSYLDLILRSITEPGLLRAFVKFLLDDEKFDGQRIIDVLIERLSTTDANLCMVTMALFDTLLGLHCEDLMLELLLKYLLPGKHVPIAFRHKINTIDPYAKHAEVFLDLTPDVMKRARELTKHKHLGDTISSQNSLQQSLPSPTSTLSKTIGANWNYYGFHTGDSLFANFHAYLYEAHYRIQQCRAACSKWANAYKYQKYPVKQTRANAYTLELIKQFLDEFSESPVANLEAPMRENIDATAEKNKFDSLPSIGESSGYESFKWRPADEDDELKTETLGIAATNANAADDAAIDKSELVPWRISSERSELLLTEFDISEDLFAKGQVSLGPFINAIWGKLQTFTSNSLYVNLHLTGLISRLAWYPLPLLHSILLRADILQTTDTPSFHQVLKILKQQLDAELPVTEDSLEIIDVARAHLIDREFRLINARKVHTDTASPVHALKSAQRSNQQATPLQVTPSSVYDPFKRQDAKRKSISKSITSMFSRKTNASSGLSQIYAFFTGNNSGSASNSGTFDRSTAPSSSTSTAYAGSQETSLSNVSSYSSIAEPERAQISNATTQQRVSSHAGGAATNADNAVANNAATTTQNSSLSATQSTLGALTNLPLSISATGGNSGPASLDSLSSLGAIASTSGTERSRDLALCAVLLDEWLKELAAIAQEQALMLINDRI